MSEELKMCSCKRAPKLVRYYDLVWAVECCACEIYTNRFWTDEEAIAAWNTRKEGQGHERD